MRSYKDGIYTARQTVALDRGISITYRRPPEVVDTVREQLPLRRNEDSARD